MILMSGEKILFSRSIVINPFQQPCEIPKISVNSEVLFQPKWEMVEITFQIKLTLKQSWPTLERQWAFITCQLLNH